MITKISGKQPCMCKSTHNFLSISFLQKPFPTFCWSVHFYQGGWKQEASHSCQLFISTLCFWFVEDPEFLCSWTHFTHLVSRSGKGGGEEEKHYSCPWFPPAVQDLVLQNSNLGQWSHRLATEKDKGLWEYSGHWPLDFATGNSRSVGSRSQFYR